MNQIRIESFDDLLDFIITYHLPIEKYVEVLNAFTKQFLILLDDDMTKNEFIHELQKMRTAIEQRNELPLFITTKSLDVN